jgi:hypothetical protein
MPSCQIVLEILLKIQINLLNTSQKLSCFITDSENRGKMAKREQKF